MKSIRNLAILTFMTAASFGANAGTQSFDCGKSYTFNSDNKGNSLNGIDSICWNNLPPNPERKTVQWLTFDFTSKKFFTVHENKETGEIGTHFVMGTRALNGTTEFKGIFFGAKGFHRGDGEEGRQRPENCPRTQQSDPKIYFQIRYPQPSDIGPMAGHVSCADAYNDKYIEDGVTYNVRIRSAEDGMAYWIYKNGQLWSYNYIADTRFPSALQYVQSYASWGQGSRVPFGQPFLKEISMQDVINDTTGGKVYLDHQKTNTQIGFAAVSVIPNQGKDPKKHWEIVLKNIQTGWDWF